MLGVVGLFLMLVIARLTDRAYLQHATLAGRASGLVARRVIDAIAVVGWLCDRPPMPAMGTAAAVRSPEMPARGRRAA
ncbi:MAG: hypothetical protein ACRD3G_25925 [Vicinamibacterales bacterium]